jgi:hypothetical protein
VARVWLLAGVIAVLLSAVAIAATPRRGEFKGDVTPTGNTAQGPGKITLDVEGPSDARKIASLKTTNKMSCGHDTINGVRFEGLKVDDEGRFKRRTTKQLTIHDGMGKPIGKQDYRQRVQGRFTSKRKATGTLTVQRFEGDQPACAKDTYEFVATLQE